MDQVPTFSRALCLCQWQLHQRPEHPGEGPQEDRHHRQLPTGDSIVSHLLKRLDPKPILFAGLWISTGEWDSH